MSDNLLFCSLEPYVGSPNRVNSELLGREEIWLRTQGIMEHSVTSNEFDATLNI